MVISISFVCFHLVVSKSFLRFVDYLLNGLRRENLNAIFKYRSEKYGALVTFVIDRLKNLFVRGI